MTDVGLSQDFQRSGGRCCRRGSGRRSEPFPLPDFPAPLLWVGLVAAATAMHQVLEQLELRTSGQGFTRLNDPLNNWIAGAGIQLGVLHLTCLHTSASLTINENADPRVLKDLAMWMDAVVPQDGRGPLDGQGQRTRYLHDDEGDDDMPAHIRTALTAQTMSLSVKGGRLLLGTWQAINLERDRPGTKPQSPHAI